MDTIFALASAQGRAGVSVIRISGPEAHAAALSVCASLPTGRNPVLRTLRDRSGQMIDQALVLRFDAPHSFTGEDVIELQVHGSIAVVKSVIETLSDFKDARLAEPGEFTRRALENEKLDLTQIEGLADLIDAETEVQRRQAVRALSGELRHRVEEWRTKLIRAAALLEATIDFADEEVPVDVTPEVATLLSDVLQDLSQDFDGIKFAERIRTGFDIAIVGAPNVGKSTLLNRLAGREAAITSEIAGTTRDVIEVRMDLDGLPVTFLDTAGLRESVDEIEAIGIERAMQRADQADLRVFLVLSDDPLPITPQNEDIVLKAKADVHEVLAGGVSGKTGLGVDRLVGQISEILASRASRAGLATHERHRVAIAAAIKGISDAQVQLDYGPAAYDICSEELRAAIRSLENLVGRIDVENILDEIFSSFCLGK